MESLELLANNVANASTAGYKADREFYSLYLAPEAQEADSSSTMPLIDRAWIDLSQGVIQSTGNPLDVALSGKGFFSADGPGGAVYTRNGNFRLGADGTITTAEGYPVRGVGGVNLTLDPAQPVEILADGTVRQGADTVGQLEITDFNGTAGLSKQGNTFFRVSDPLLAGAAPSAAAVTQGKLEQSNTGSAESAVRLVNVMRQFEMLQKAMTLGSDMSRQAIQQVARVGQ